MRTKWKLRIITESFEIRWLMAITRKGNPKWRIHPGRILQEEYLRLLNLSATALAKELHVSVPTVNDIVRGRRAVTADMAVRLARYFGTTEQFWLNLQDAYDVSLAKERLADKLREIKPAPRRAVA
jgi:antitoxin HigA-1